MIASSNGITIYVSGPMTGLPDYNYPAFNDAAQRLRALGYTVLNPADNEPRDGSASYEHYMRLDFQRLANKADAVALLPNWQRSPGARAEVEIALLMGMTIAPLEVFVDRAHQVLRSMLYYEAMQALALARETGKPEHDDQAITSLNHALRVVDAVPEIRMVDGERVIVPAGFQDDVAL